MRQSVCGIISLTLGICSFLFVCVLPGIGLILHITCLILGIIGACEKTRGHGCAIAGIIINSFGIILTGLALLLYVVFNSSLKSYMNEINNLQNYIMQ